MENMESCFVPGTAHQNDAGVGEFHRADSTRREGNPLPSRCGLAVPFGPMSARLAASSDPIMLFRRALPTSLRTAEGWMLIVEAKKLPCRWPLRDKGTRERPAGPELEE